MINELKGVGSFSKWGLLLVCCLWTSTSSAQQSAQQVQPYGEKAGLVINPIGFADPTEAANYELAQVSIGCPDNIECGGVIYLGTDGDYYPTVPFTSFKPFGVDIPQYNQPMPPGMVKIVADYHDHVCSKHNAVFANFFSSADAYVNQGFHTVGYMLSHCDGNIHRYDPSQDDRDDEEVDFHSGKKIYLTIGHIVGWVPGGAYKPD